MIFVTKNINKFNEAKTILGIDHLKQKKFDLVEIQETEVEKVIDTKLDSVNFDCIVEDSALYLGKDKEIGALIKFFPKTRIVKAYKGETAIAVCCIGYKKDRNKLFFKGEIKGKIVEPKGDFGFGWDDIFKPDGFDKTFGQMNEEEKNSCSQRKKAFELLKNYLKNV